MASAMTQRMHELIEEARQTCAGLESAIDPDNYKQVLAQSIKECEASLQIIAARAKIDFQHQINEDIERIAIIAEQRLLESLVKGLATSDEGELDERIANEPNTRIPYKD